MQEELWEAIRGQLIFAFLLSLIAVSSAHLAEGIELELNAYRLQQYDIVGTPVGSRAQQFSLEAAALDSTTLRRCFIVGWRSLVGRELNDWLGGSVQEARARLQGALLIAIPRKSQTLTPEDLSIFHELERRLLALRTDVAVYLVHESAALDALIAEVNSSGKRAPSAWQQLVQAVAGSSYQLSTLNTEGTATAREPRSSNVIAHLSASTLDAPTLLFTADYDSQAIAPALGTGATSNGAGSAALLELLAVLRRFYESPAVSEPPPFNLIFAWTAAGRFGYQGARALADDLGEKEVGKPQLVVCLETLVSAESPDARQLFVHVAKQPAAGGAAAKFLERLEAAATVSGNQSVEIRAKKINLNAPLLAWPHERFNVRRLPGLTISSLGSPDDTIRRSLVDEEVDIPQLAARVRLLSEALLTYVLQLDAATEQRDDGVRPSAALLPPDAVNEQRLTHFVRRFAARPRSLEDDAATDRVVTDILASAKHYSSQVYRQQVQMPDVVVYGALRDKIQVERVKPAIFELFVAAAVGFYLVTLVFLAIRAQHAIENTVGTLRKVV